MVNIKTLLDLIKKYYKYKDIMNNSSYIDNVLKYVKKLIKVVNYTLNMDALAYVAYF